MPPDVNVLRTLVRYAARLGASVGRRARAQMSCLSVRAAWALDLKNTGIRIDVLSPGGTITPGLTEVFADGGAAQV